MPALANTLFAAGTCTAVAGARTRVESPRPLAFSVPWAQPRDRAPSLTRLAPSPLPFADQRSLTTTW